ncbi:MAG: Gfo/Idh/MocA family oxidoreductase [Planctomycetia bacterium]|nr:Gfo/Idh/MocA family oxidoreductase [Planctomycetia bacterium]
MIRRNFMKTSLAMGAALLAKKGLAEKPEQQFRRIKIGQIGVRHGHASGKMASLKLLPEYFEIVGIAAESPADEKAHRNDGVYSGLKWMTEEELLNTPGLEAVTVETELTELMPTATRVAKRGLPMHVDKPLGQSMAECQEMIDACRANRVYMQPGYMYRTNQAMRLLLKAIRNGWLGEIHDISGDMCRNDTDPKFRKFRSQYRGGGMYFFGSHLLDFIVEAMGAPEEIHVLERPDPNDGLQDNTLSVLLYRKAIAQVRVSMRKIDGNPTRRLTAFGTKGSFVLDPLENWNRDPKTGKMRPLNVRLTLSESNDTFQAGTHHLSLEPYEDRYVGQLMEFARVVRGLQENPYTLDYELLSQRVILAASGYTKWEKQG